MSENQEEPRLMAQWIVSLAVSVVCCAVLFIVFAGYIVDLHDASTLTAVRLEVTQEKLSHISNDLEQLRRSVQPAAPVAAKPVVSQQPETAAPQDAVPAAVAQPTDPAQPEKKAAPATTEPTQPSKP